MGRACVSCHLRSTSPVLAVLYAPLHLPCLCGWSVLQLLTAFSKSFALSQLTAKATLNSYVKTIPLPKTSGYLPTGTKCSIAGWGLIDKDQETSKLFETKVTIYSRRKCIRFYPHLNAGMVCAGSFHELRDSSQVQLRGSATGQGAACSGGCSWHRLGRTPGEVTRTQFLCPGGRAPGMPLAS